MSNLDYKEAKKRSVDNLQRLYTVVVSLAITESLRRLISGVNGTSTVPSDYSHWLMFISLLATLIPFYHGANRYLDATYVTGERQAKRAALMVDFLALFAEGLLFFALGSSIPSGPVFFYTFLAGLYFFDAMWVGSTQLTAAHEDDKWPGYRVWALVNVAAASLLLLMMWTKIFTGGSSIWRSEMAGNVAPMLVAVGRTIFDYVKVWPFYYPKGIDVIPAPPPAPPPVAEKEQSS